MEAFIQMINSFLLLCAPCGLHTTECTLEVTAPEKLFKTRGTSEQSGRSFRVTPQRKFSMLQFKIRSP